MIARISDELAAELERRGDEPLPVANPRTNRTYLFVAADRYTVVPQPFPEEDAAATDGWNERSTPAGLR